MTNTEQKPVVNIYTESNPNPNSLKFVANFMLVEPGTSYDFPDPQSAEEAPLAAELFMYDFVERVFYMSNFITVTKSDRVEWFEVQEAIKDHIKSYLEEDKPLLNMGFANRQTSGGPDPAESLAEESELDIRIRGLLDEYVKPAVEQDGGHIEYVSFYDGVVKVQLQGSCSGCPSSMVTLKSGIENLLKSMVPEVKSVEAEGV
jgi:Fe-S cluster biogenesis protein NfuA